MRSITSPSGVTACSRTGGHINATMIVRLAFVTGLALAAGPAEAQHQRVARTLHNLSVTGPGTVKSLTETEVCKFCHLPHNAVEPTPLWGHALSTVPRYDVPQMSSTRSRSDIPPQPDGSSRLCLSCHDGTVALGQIGARPVPVPMSGPQRLVGGQSGHLGTDLSGSHPISFLVSAVAGAPLDPSQDIGVRPEIGAPGAPGIRLDADGKMQCTTCHDPHADMYYQLGKTPHFWVRPTVTEVCLACHELR